MAASQKTHRKIALAEPVSAPAEVLRAGESSLPELARDINAEHELARAAFQKGLEHGRNVGELLLKAKAQIKAQGGKWLPWLLENCDVGVRMAQAYMRLAERWPQLVRAVEDTQRVAYLEDLPMREALALLATHNQHTEPPEPESDAQTASETSPEFPKVDEDLKTDYRCPHCGYEWSGNDPKPPTNAKIEDYD